MKSSRVVRRAVLAPLVIAVVGLVQPVLADEGSTGYRRYDTQGRYVGSARSPSEGRLRFYDSKGQLTGTARRQRDGNWRTYDTKGQYTGTIREEKR